ncbi:MFS transporter [Luteitalea sp. TBR-22]|uniref:MFS transporter n=1 Tax=Luteitalea sp. TBR-22 TaxID=2802971 RepID=UPI001AF7ADCF|nr:MFS transporter [Luteitalea sp. TBR-22]BCS33146.1 MFS transporter [Luteitalea sp. TBR-22]
MAQPSATRDSQRAITLSVMVAALGYFVDIYDLLLFSIVRVPSLRSLGIEGDELLRAGERLLNMQMTGMLLGGLLWGVLGDRKGRLSVLFGSIFMYSAANIANAWVQSVEAYAWLRFIAGIGLAGELGAGITLVSEIMPKETRGYGTTIVAATGILGAVFAALVGDMFDWRVSYIVGGVMGFALLALRIGVYESGMFEAVKQIGSSRGNVLQLFNRWDRARKYFAVILIGVPIWYVIGILITFSPELGKALGMTEVPAAGRAVMFAYLGLAGGDFASGFFSQFIGSRRRVVLLFQLLTTVFVATYFFLAPFTLTGFYALCVALGFSVGYWAVFVTVASEQFGTNIRATATTTVPNVVRGSVVLLTSSVAWLRPQVGVVRSAIIVGMVALAISYVALWGLEETFGKDLDYVEE